MEGWEGETEGTRVGTVEGFRVGAMEGVDELNPTKAAFTLMVPL